jgi:release factor glutamine methyltransferase
MTLALAAGSTVGDALAAATTRLAAAGVPEPRADAEVLLAWVLGVARPMLVIRGREVLDADAAARFEAALGRRARREPVAYVTGTREFWSLPITVGRGALVPRPETELVVATALRVAPGARRVLDVGTGSGAIAVALARELRRATVVASDRMAPALTVAAVNRARLAPRVALVRGDLLEPFRAHAFDLVVANPPYCADGTVVQAEVRDWEPATALYAGPDGLRVLGALAGAAPRVLRPGGWLVVEVGAGQAGTVVARLRALERYAQVQVEPDLAGIERVIAARTRDDAGAADGS